MHVMITIQADVEDLAAAKTKWQQLKTKLADQPELVLDIHVSANKKEVEAVTS